MSSSSFALTDLEINNGGFAGDAICSHPTDLSFCVEKKEPDATKTACLKQLSHMQAANTRLTMWYVSNTTSVCRYKYTDPDVKDLIYDIDHALSTRKGMCPLSGKPPPRPIFFTRQGRWFSQEITGNRCYDKCEYSINSTTFTHKHFVFTNGVLTQFNQTGSATSNALFCEMKPEPSRNDAGETNYDANCDDSVFTVFCEFVEWFRTDSEMPDAPPVENKTLAFDTHLKTDRFYIQDNSQYNCFAPIEFDLYLPWSSDRVIQTIDFQVMCNGISQFGNFLRALYLMFAALIIFRK